MAFLANNIDLASLLKNKKKITNALIIVLALMVSFNIYSRQNKLNLSIKSKVELENKRNRLLDMLSISETKITAYKNLLVDRDLTSVINAVNQIARDSRVKIVSVKPRKEQDFIIYKKMSVGVFLLADNYHRVGEFVSRLESSSDIYKLEVLKIIPAKKLSSTVGSGVAQEEGASLFIEAEISRFSFQQ